MRRSCGGTRATSKLPLTKIAIRCTLMRTLSKLRVHIRRQRISNHYTLLLIFQVDLSLLVSSSTTLFPLSNNKSALLASRTAVSTASDRSMWKNGLSTPYTGSRLLLSRASSTTTCWLSISCLITLPFATPFLVVSTLPLCFSFVLLSSSISSTSFFLAPASLLSFSVAPAKELATE